MDFTPLKDVNELWIKIYPYLAGQLMDQYDRVDTDVLELATFAGGVSMELARFHPGLNSQHPRSIGSKGGRLFAETN